MRHFQRAQLFKSTKNNGIKLLILTKKHNVRAWRTRQMRIITTSPGVRNAGAFALAFVKQKPYLLNSPGSEHRRRQPLHRDPHQGTQKAPGWLLPSFLPLARHQGAARPGAAAAPRQGLARAEGAAGCPRSEAPPQDQTGTAARAGSSQDARSVSRAPGAQLPAPDLPGDLPQPVPGMDTDQDCSRAGSRAPEAAATPPGSSPGRPEGPRRAAAVLPSPRPAPGRSAPRSRSSSPPGPGQGRRRCRVSSIRGTRPRIRPAPLPVLDPPRMRAACPERPARSCRRRILPEISRSRCPEWTLPRTAAAPDPEHRRRQPLHRDPHQDAQKAPRRAAAVLPSPHPAPGRSAPRSRSSSPPGPGQGRRRCRVSSIRGTAPGSDRRRQPDKD